METTKFTLRPSKESAMKKNSCSAKIERGQNEVC